MAVLSHQQVIRGCRYGLTLGGGLLATALETPGRFPHLQAEVLHKPPIFSQLPGQLLPGSNSGSSSNNSPSLPLPERGPLPSRFHGEMFACVEEPWTPELALTGRREPPRLLGTYLTDHFATSIKEYSLDLMFQEITAPLLKHEELITAELRDQATEIYSQPLQLLQHVQADDLDWKTADEAFLFQTDPFYQMDQLLLHESLWDSLNYLAGQFYWGGNSASYGFRRELETMTAGPQTATPLQLGERVAVIGDSTDVHSFSTATPLNADMARNRDYYQGQYAPRVGIQYEILPELVSGYYLFDQHSHVTDADGFWEESSLFSPFGGDSHRAGVRAQLMDGRWVLQASSFYSEADLASMFVPSPYYDWSRGVEVSVQAKVTQNWKTTIRLSDIESQVSTPQGSADWVPPQKSTTTYASIWNRYSLIQNENESLTLGLGTRLFGTYRSRYADSLLLPGYSRWDLGIFYQRGTLEMRMYIKGILDKGYYGDLSYLLNDPKSPLNVEAQLQLRY